MKNARSHINRWSRSLTVCFLVATLFVAVLAPASSQVDTEQPTGAVAFVKDSVLAGPVVDLAGSAADNVGVAEVRVGVRDRNSGLWWRSDGTFEASSLRYQASLDSPGAAATDWSFEADLPAGDYWVSVYVYDIADNFVALSWVRFSVVLVGNDTTPPAGSVGFVKDSVLPGPVVDLAGVATDNIGVGEVRVGIRDRNSGLWWRADGTFEASSLRYQASLDSPGAAETDWSFAADLPDGDYWVSVNVSDLADNFVALPWVRFSVAPETVDTEPPTGAVGFVKDSVLAGPVVDLAGSAADNVGVSQVRVGVRDRNSGLWWRSDGTFAAGTARYSASLDSPGTTSTGWSLAPTLPEGDYWVSVNVFDTAGNVVALPWVRFSVLHVDQGAPGQIVIIPAGAPWRYDDGGVAPDAGWNDFGFDDLGWERGAAQIGFGDGDEATVTKSGVMTTYFRREFGVADPDAISGLAFDLVRDDGAIVYINGKEVLRTNMPAGDVDHTTPAAGTTTGENNVRTFTAPAVNLVAGKNVIAVEVHNASLASSDLSFDLALYATDSNAKPGPVHPGTLVIAAGDIAQCNDLFDEQTARLVGAIAATEDPIIAGLGDYAYAVGTDEQFDDCYDPTWGAFASNTYPVAGNHEYKDPGAAGYFNFFGDRAAGPNGYYSFDIDENWHAVFLNSNCTEVANICADNGAQEQWMRADLAAHADMNVVLIWHHPRYTNNHYTNFQNMDPFWDAGYELGADLVLTGHEHHYERYAPINGSSAVSSDGMRQFIVGTGGADLRPIERPVDARSELRNNGTHGILKLYLQADGYAWEFVPVHGATFSDSGTGTVNP